MSNLSVVTGNADPILVLSATGTGPSATTFIHNSGAESSHPGSLFPSVFEFVITDIVGSFVSLQVNLEWSPITATGTPQFQTIGTWAPLTSPTAFFPCSATGAYRLNCTAFSGGTSFNVYASIASSMPQSTGGGGGGSVTQGTVPWTDNVSQVAGIALGATAVVAYGSTPAAVNVPGVNAFITNAGSIGGGTQFVDNAVSGAAPTGTLSMGWDSVNSKVRALKVDSSQNLLVDVSNASIAVTGTFFQATQPVSIAAAIDVSDRAARLLGVVYGSQAQQLKQTATNFNLQVELATGGTLYDARQIRALTSADVVTAAQGTAAALSGKWPVQVTDGTNVMPTGDVIARALFQKITDGTNGPVAVKPASTIPLVTDSSLVAVLSPSTPLWVQQWGSTQSAVNQIALTAINIASNTKNALTVAVVDQNGSQIGSSASPVFTAMMGLASGTLLETVSVNTAGFGVALDVNLNSIAGQSFVSAVGGIGIPITDGSGHGPVAVKASSTAALAIDAALVVAISPNSRTVSGSFGATPQPTTESQPIGDVLIQILLALDAVNMNLGRLMAGDPMSRQELANSEF
jgi:hypothetical protein